MPQVTILQKVLDTIFNRENCLLPAYFVINEIRKAYMENGSWPYWVKVPFFQFIFLLVRRTCAYL